LQIRQQVLQSRYRQGMLKFKDFEFKIPDGVKKPCVNVSGGVDSALALYLTVSALDKYNAEITVLTLCHPNKKH